MKIYEVLIVAASSWYISYALTSTHGAFGMFERLREWRGGRWHGRRGNLVTKSFVPSNEINLAAQEVSMVHNELAKNGLLDCIVCLIFWLALIIGYLQGLTVLESIAAAGVGLWLHGFTGWLYKQ